jgi:poly(3-hydroxybutyrate) depolymerase
MQSGGGNRSYILRIPDNYDNTRQYRLVFAYHWRGGTMQDVDGGGSSGAAWSYYGLREQADDSTIFVAPQGIGNGWPNSGGQDVEFTDDMFDLIQGDLCVDKSRVFALGFSFGGGMSYALACARPNVFRAVAVYSGGVISGCDGGTQPVAYLGIHGMGDDVLGIGGGRDMRDRFVENNGCTDQDPPEPNPGSQMHTCTTYQGCTAGYPVGGVRSTVVTHRAWWTVAVTTAPALGPRPRPGSSSRSSKRGLGGVTFDADCTRGGGVRFELRAFTRLAFHGNRWGSLRPQRGQF